MSESLLEYINRSKVNNQKLITSNEIEGAFEAGVITTLAYMEAFYEIELQSTDFKKQKNKLFHAMKFNRQPVQ